MPSESSNETLSCSSIKTRKRQEKKKLLKTSSVLQSLLEHANPPPALTITEEEREKIKNDSEQLLEKTNLYSQVEEFVTCVKKNDPMHNSLQDITDKTHSELPDDASNEFKLLENKLIPPEKRYPVPKDNFIEILNEDVNLSADISSLTAKLNLICPQQTFEELKHIPIEKWPTLQYMYKDLWSQSKQLSDVSQSSLSSSSSSSITISHLLEAFTEDTKEIELVLNNTLKSVSNDKNDDSSESLKTSKGWLMTKRHILSEEDQRKRRRIDLKSNENELNSQWLITALKNSKTPIDPDTQEPFWNITDPDTTLYTDSDEDDNQTMLRHPPFLRPLRRVLREIHQKEQLNFITGKCFKVFNETKDLDQVLQHNLDLVHKQLYTKYERTCRKNRKEWREWINAVKYILHTQDILTPLDQHHVKQLSNEFIQTLQHFQMISSNEQLPSWRICRNLLRHFATLFPYYLNDYIPPTNHTTYCDRYGRHPFQWSIQNAPEITNFADSAYTDSDDKAVYTVSMGSPGTRCYIGRASTIWGSPCGEGYHRTHFWKEIIFWFRRLNGCLNPLHYIPHHKERKHFLKLTSNQLNRFEQQTNEADHTGAMHAALTLQTEGAGYDISTSGQKWMTGIKVNKEIDSSDLSETEVVFNKRQKTQMQHNNINLFDSKKFIFSGFSHDNDVVRLGRYGRLRSQWSKPQILRRQVQPVVNQSSIHQLRPPIVPDYSSSEDSAIVHIDSQKKYRQRSRQTRKLIQQQHSDMNDPLPSSNIHNKKFKRDMKILSSLYDHSLGPLEPTFEYPLYDKEWPISCIDSFEKQCQLETNSTRTNQHSHPQNAMLSNCRPIGMIEDSITYLSGKKNRVRDVEPQFDRDPSSHIPLGFMSCGTDLSGKEFQLIGIDNNEFWRRMGDNKFVYKSLYEFSDVLKGSREYYAIIDEENHHVTVVPGGTLSLFWTQTSLQNYRDLHWYALWRLWMNGSFRRKYLQKTARYTIMRRQGWFLWRKYLDQILKIESRISEASAYRQPKYTKPTIQTYSHKKKLDQLCYTPINEELLSSKHSIQDLMKELPESDDDVVLTDVLSADIETNHQLHNEIKQDNDVQTCISNDIDWEDTDEQTCQLSSLSSSKDFHRDAEHCRQLQQIAYSKYHYSQLYKRHKGIIPHWVWGWNSVKNKMMRRIPSRYAHMISRYYHGILPNYIHEYKTARQEMAEKNKAEIEFSTLNKLKQKKKEDVGHVSSHHISLYDQQLTGALQVLKETNKSSKIETKEHPPSLEIKNQRYKKQFKLMQSALPQFTLKATVPKDIYDKNDVLPLYVISDIAPGIILSYFNNGSHTMSQDTQRLTATVKSLMDLILKKKFIKHSIRSNIEAIAAELTILNVLIQLYSDHRRSYAESSLLENKLTSYNPDGSLRGISSVLFQWIVNRFFVRDERGVLHMTKEGTIRLMSTILWLCMSLNGEWVFNYNALLHQDWNQHYTEKFKDCALLMGMQQFISNDQSDSLKGHPINHPMSSTIDSDHLNVWHLIAPLQIYTGIPEKMKGHTIDTSFGQSSASVFFNDTGRKRRKKGSGIR